jgi:hypothetical protein
MKEAHEAFATAQQQTKLPTNTDDMAQFEEMMKVLDAQRLERWNKFLAAREARKNKVN